MVLPVFAAGGLAEEVDEKTLHAAFIPFGDIMDIQIPLDYETEQHRGFAFVEFELAAVSSLTVSAVLYCRFDCKIKEMQRAAKSHLFLSIADVNKCFDYKFRNLQT